MKKNDLHKLFRHPNDHDFTKAITIDPEDKAFLQEARVKVEKAILAGFRELRRNDNPETNDIAMPKFAMQGSWVYRTINAPAYPPGQQMDVDMGVYMPFSDLGDGQQPRLAAKIYFGAVERILEEFIRNHESTWVLDKSKDTCTRIKFPNGRMHMDLPLYAYPDDEAHRIQESILKASNESLMFHDGIELFAADKVEPTVIHMAYRNDGWKASDALIIRHWVEDSIKSHGSQNEVRSICRYLKAWRDEIWRDGGGPSSIFLLAFCIREYEQNDTKLDQLLENVINKLPNAFDRPLSIPCPTTENSQAMEDLTKRYDHTEKVAIINEFLSLKRHFNSARTDTIHANANKLLQDIFGPRFPFDPAKIETVIPSSIGPTVLSQRAKPVPNKATSETSAG